MDDFPVAADVLPIYAELFALRRRGAADTWILAGNMVGGVANLEMPAVLPGRSRPGTATEEPELLMFLLFLYRGVHNAGFMFFVKPI